MITGELRSKVDRVWDAFWSGGIANPIEMKDARFTKRLRAGRSVVGERGLVETSHIHGAVFGLRH